jgi:pyridinium-3,5-biscarboxylic acid mononucleotide synthase
MNQEELKEILTEVRNGAINVQDAITRLKWLPFDQLLDANIDSHRELRTGQPEVIYSEGKSSEQLLEIVHNRNHSGADILLTRLSFGAASVISESDRQFVYYESARVGVRFSREDLTPVRSDLGVVAVISAGTSDKPVAEEAALTAWIMGAETERIYDVGVAGLHRLQTARSAMERADCIVVVAGMEGALASVIGGLTDKPVIATPTSVGYGASFSGIAALLGMLNCCASGVTVVNIDNGFGAGAAAAKIARLCTRKPGIAAEEKGSLATTSE